MKPEHNSKLSQIQRDLPDDIVRHIDGFLPQQNADDRGFVETDGRSFEEIYGPGGTQRGPPPKILRSRFGFTQNAQDWHPCPTRELLEQEESLQGTPIMEELSLYRKTLRIRSELLADTQTELNTQNNIRLTLVSENDKLRKDISTLKSDWAMDRQELKAVLKENMELTEQQELDTAQMLMSLKNSGAFDGSLDWKNISSDRMEEIRRKEQVIRNKDGKATRLIAIIRGKNRIIANLRQVVANLNNGLKSAQANENFMRGSLGMVSEVVNNEATVVYHPSELAQLYRSPENLIRSKKPYQVPSWESWIERRFSKTS